MRQKKIRTIGDALEASTLAIAGATEMGVDMLKHQTAPVLRATRAALVTARNRHDGEKVLLREREASLRDIKAEARTFARIARDLLKIDLGTQHSPSWNAAGFLGSLEIPRTTSGLKITFELLTAYLAVHPEVQHLPRNISALRAKSLFDGVCATESAVCSQEAVVNEAKVERDKKFEVMRSGLRMLIRELTGLLSPTDSRWLTFGLRKPGSKQTPDVPEDVSVQIVHEAAVDIRWKASPRAEYYRVWLKVEGVDPESRAVGSPADLDFMLQEIVAGSTVEVSLSAVNDGGESRRSTSVRVTMPMSRA